MSRWLPALLGAVLAVTVTAVVGVLHFAYPNVETVTNRVAEPIVLKTGDGPGQVDAALTQLLRNQTVTAAGGGITQDGNVVKCRRAVNPGADLATGAGFAWYVEVCVIAPGSDPVG